MEVTSSPTACRQNRYGESTPSALPSACQPPESQVDVENKGGEMPGTRAHTCSPGCGFRRYPRMPGKQKLSAPPAGAGSDPALVPAQTSNSVGELCVSHVRGEVLQMLEFAFLLVRISGSHFRKDPTVSLAS